ncbi:acyltransferase [Streptomyces sp. NA04227]|uniref:acyltransferase family protein n=1 Tax=Streptomyces sp. NA04227 TaxID=2742136 RepID=UPI001592427C|nr:acyltransferase [Streptomyces sp. NA04227]QKW10549.1 acyltransferase [Streptomyces sp. NA04227]
MKDQTAAPDPNGSPQRPTQLPSLTGLRFLAALIVFLYHASYLAGPLRPTAPINFFNDPDIAQPVADFFQPAGRIGVSFFFVLSGFVLAWSATPGSKLTTFWRRRALKIYPNHIVMWTLAMWLYASTAPTEAWLSNLLLVHTFSNRPDIAASINSPSWSLCSEVLFYALFPLFLLAVRRINPHRLWWWTAAMITGIATMATATKHLVTGGLPSPFSNLTANQEWFGYAFPPPRLFEFILGMLLARIVAENLWPPIGLWPSTLLFTAGYALALAVPAPYNFSLTTVIPIGMILCAAATRDLHGQTSWLATRPMIWLGNISFAFYLVQGVVIFYGRPELLGAHTYNTPTALAMFTLLLLANLLAAWLLHRLIEQPVMRRWSHPTKKPTPHTPHHNNPQPANETV